MRIKRLEIIGFKSFVDKVSFDFTEGVTAVVGPNGCGKSNVVDATRWVMGEQSAKNLRGRQMEDVIFGGSESRKPLGMAEVSLVFSTEDGRVPAKYLSYSEIQVTRRLYRDGTSEYSLNKTPCRLLDIAELFMDTGVGARAYSIIEQGRIGMILLAKPEDRRFLIEEAAGVTKFKARKQVALKKIDVTRQNLIRIGDIVAEIRRQLNSLQRQAKKAERFRACREELREIDLLFASREYLSLEEQRNQAAVKLSDLSSQESALTTRLQSGELALEERRVSLLEEEKFLTASQEEIYRVRGEMQSAENRLEFHRKEYFNLERHRERLAEELSNLEKQKGEAEVELKALEERKGAFIAELGDEEQSLDAREKELEEMAAAEAMLTSRQEESRHELFSVLSQIAKFGNQEAAARKLLESMAERVDRNRTEEAHLAEKKITVATRRAELEADLRNLAERKEELASELGRLKRREDELRDLLAGNEKELLSRRNELSGKKSRLESLQELETQFAGYGQGVRTLFLSDRFRSGFAGVLADLIETDAEVETSIEAVLGERLQYVVCHNTKDALHALAYLREHAGGRCGFVLPWTVPLSGKTSPAQAQKLLDRVRVKEGFEQVVAALLDGVFLVSALTEALELARQHPNLTFVTPEGDVAGESGTLTGGSPESVEQGLIHKKREIKDLLAEVARLGDELSGEERERERLTSERAAVEEGLRNIRQEQHRIEIEQVNLEKDLQRSCEEQQRIEERLAIKEMEDDQLREERAVLEKDLAAADSQRTELEERKSVLEQEVAASHGAIAARRAEIDSAREGVTVLKVRVAALKEKRESNLRAIQRVSELLRDLAARSSALHEELCRGERDGVRLKEEISTGETHLSTLQKMQYEAETAFVAVKARYDNLTALLHDEEAQLRGVRGENDTVRHALADANLRLSELAMRLQHLEGTLRDRYRLELVPLVPKYQDVAFDEEASRRRYSELERQIEEMGEVNLTAIDEFRELEERHTFLTDQKKDLEESLNGLHQAIQRINRTTRRRFLETFQLVNDKFQEVFPRLFCGGRAELRLTNEEDLLETGIDIIVQPPGKKLQNVTLLSGGEKALTAVALIFSIFLIKPSPFCLLDEVDAPLDDANIGRFNDMIREMTAFSQFILITHSKTTMAVADTLYGITMEEPGVSKLVSVRLL